MGAALPLLVRVGDSGTRGAGLPLLVRAGDSGPSPMCAAASKFKAAASRRDIIGKFE